MKRTIALLAAAAFCMVCPVQAEFVVSDTGTWPKSWPEELEPLRGQSRSFEGPRILQLLYLIPFTKREDFESAWPHLLKVKSKGAPIILLRGPRTDFFEVKPGGVLIHSPPAATDKRANPETPLPGQHDVRTKWRNTTYIELVVDGEVVDLNRIALPEDTPIVDERFKDEPKQ